MKNSLNSKVCRLISLISKDARDYVNNAFNNQTVKLVHYEESHLNHGVFCIVENEDCIIAFAAFTRYSHDESLLNLMAKQLSGHLSPNETKEVCFNVYGKNKDLVQFVKELGFVTDMEGFQLQYDFSKEMKMPAMFPLVEKVITPEMLSNFIQLFENAYYDLNVENGWRTDTYQKAQDNFLNSLQNYESAERVRSFWIDGKLIGAYIITGEYIQDFVIHPEYQNRGYGSMMLKNCIYRMTEQLGIKNILLRVAQSNSGAKRFYERNNFIELANFAEHTFVSRTS
ncbi:GNAT family N-acetyltransferase [Lederbergia panacisoli]|uniref:GNAT family N-acetyltransferase n=1 Tax=Lederbergia panacisoli TaxID=1255251 RepID=UPI00214BF93A|nr:GNAT family N-acetyltransferase [Lederbergia panacisoli]MCR2820764.1 GNAT family N-acetyltransferase [Lederbergia panacisoli]